MNHCYSWLVNWCVMNLSCVLKHQWNHNGTVCVGPLARVHARGAHAGAAVSTAGLWLDLDLQAQPKYAAGRICAASQDLPIPEASVLLGGERITTRNWWSHGFFGVRTRELWTAEWKKQLWKMKQWNNWANHLNCHLIQLSIYHP